MTAYLCPDTELGRILIYEAARDWLPTVAGQVQTPLGIADAEFVDPMQPVKVRPVPLGTSPRLTGWAWHRPEVLHSNSVPAGPGN